jgi:ferredoxin
MMCQFPRIIITMLMLSLVVSRATAFHSQLIPPSRGMISAPFCRHGQLQHPPTLCYSSKATSAGDQPKQQHTIRWQKPDGSYLEFQASEGELLRTAALRRGVASPHNNRANLINCRGLGTCGTCAVQIIITPVVNDDHGEDNLLPPKNAIEEFRLSVPPGHGGELSKQLRLACQVSVNSDLTVIKKTGFWGQYAAIAEPSIPTLPFGPAAEFVLDRTSPPAARDDKERQ